MDTPSPLAPAFSVNQLTVNYDKTPVLWDITLAIPAGTLVGIVGPNGAGKSTLIQAALGLLSPAPISGTVKFFGAALDAVRLRVAYVPQRESVDWDFPITVIELVLMGSYGRLGLFRRPRRADWDAAHFVLNQVGLTDLADRQISQLSGGQQQRVFLARALLQQADLYLMDEPFAGVDIATEKILIDLLRKLSAEGKTVCIVHHDLNTVESYFDWLIMLNLRLVACGPTAEVFNSRNLQLAYGKNHVLLDEAFKLSRERTTGNIS